MPVGERELRRGIGLGLYPDPEKERRAQLAERNAELQARREERMVSTEERSAASQALRDKLALNEALTKQLEFKQSQDALDLDILIKQRALEAAPKIKALNPRSADYPLQRSAALGDDYRVGILLKDQLAVNDDSHKGWLAIRDADEKNAAAWEAEHGVGYPRKNDGTLDHVAAGKMRREAAAKRGLTDETLTPSGSTFKDPKAEKLGTITTDSAGKRTITRPLAPNEELKGEHDALEKELKTDWRGNPDPAAIGKINEVKAKLGYDLLDPTTGAVIPKTVAAPAAAPAVTDPANDAAWARRDAALASPAAEAPKLNPLTDDIAKSARAAIAAGKDAEAVRKRLQESGYDPSSL